MNFTAIDFETANEKRNSACSIGIVIVKDNMVTEKIHYLIKPKEMRFMPINIGIHGIRPKMVENECEFDVIWDKIKKYFENTLVIAHNASFDISVLRRTLETYNIEMPYFDYICTMKLSRNFYNKLENAKLNTVNRFLGYEFNHHDALADAMAAGNILLNIADELKCDDIDEISRLTGVTIGNVSRRGYSPSSSKGRIYKVSQREAASVREFEFKYDAFKNEVVVFTGRLSFFDRAEAMRIVRRLGGSPGSSVTRKTTILVTNTQNIQELTSEEMSTKLRKAVDLRKKGQNILILNEDEFLEKAARTINI